MLIGDASVGKTALRQRYLARAFSSSYRATIGCDFMTRPVEVEGLDQPVSLSIWDTAGEQPRDKITVDGWRAADCLLFFRSKGQDRFKSLGHAFYRGADACCLVYSDAKSLESLRSWFGEFKDRCPVEDAELREFTWVGVGSKIDVWREKGVDELVLEEQARKLFDELLPPRKDATSASKSNGYSIDGSDDVEHHAPHSPTVTSPLPHCDNPLDELNVPSSKIQVLPDRPDHGGRRHSLKRTSASLGTAIYHTAKTAPSSIYHTPSASTATDHDTGTDDGASIRTDETVTPGLSSPSTIPGGGEFFSTDAAERARDEARGVDMFMATSPPRAPHTVGMVERLGYHVGGPSVLRKDDEVMKVEQQQAIAQVNGSARGPDASPVRAEDVPTYDYSRDGIKSFKTSAKTGEGVDEL